MCGHAILVKLEHFAAAPNVGAVLRHVYRNVTDKTDAALVCVFFDLRPLCEEFVLSKLPSEIGVLVVGVNRPVTPRHVLTAVCFLQSHETAERFKISVTRDEFFNGSSVTKSQRRFFQQGESFRAEPVKFASVRSFLFSRFKLCGGEKALVFECFEIDKERVSAECGE